MLITGLTGGDTRIRRGRKEEQEIRPPEKGKGIFDHKIAGFPWPFFIEMLVIAIGVLGLVLKALGLF
jgi:hypothetical protein